MRYFILIFFFIPSLFCAGQKGKVKPAEKKAGGNFYAGFGTHRIFFTKSDIHFKDNQTGNYDFVLYNVRGRDDNDLSFGQGIDAPQYSVRLGYYLKNRSDIGFEFSYDHAKYIMIQHQKVRIEGQINGTQLDGDTSLGKDFLEFEHTDGANYVMVNFLKRKSLAKSKNQKHELSVVAKPGIGIVVPRTYSILMNNERNDRYHVSGYVVGIEGALRYDLLRNFFLEAGFKTAYANYNDIRIYGKGKARQDWWSLQTIILLGFQFR